MKTEAISFWKFLTENTIEIPILQRDYAQGRKGKEELRKSFLKDLKSALDSSQPQKLDFVYGMKEHGALNPLDGQQRLTTLWLLHWFLAYKAGAINEKTTTVFRRFTYETRISSRDFCNRLSDFSELPPPGIGIVQHITNQTWFRHSWRHDPTIQAMLRMLGGELSDSSDGIAGVFGCDRDHNRDGEDPELQVEKCYYDAYWHNLTKDDCPIVFYHLELHGLKQTDDLYVKMNARGKPLTSFENFKADLVGYIENKERNFEKEWTELSNPISGLAIKMDTDWADIFWQKRSSEGTVDEIYFAFLNRFFFSELCVAKNNNQFVVSDRNENSNAAYRYFNDDAEIAYEGLNPYKITGTDIPLASIQKIVSILDNFKRVSDTLNEGNKTIESLMDCPWNPGFCFIPEYDADDHEKMRDKTGNKIKKIRPINQVQRVVFFAVCQFFAKLGKGRENDYQEWESQLRRWMRVVWNLVSCETRDGNPAIRSFDAMRRVMVFIQGLDSQNIYECLKKLQVQVQDGDSDDGVFSLQIGEEIQKASRLLENPGLEHKIVEAEKYAFFHGAIRFLFSDGDETEKWEEQFDAKWTQARGYFDAEGVAVGYRKNALLLRGLLARLEKVSPIDERFWFGNGKAFWRNQVLLSESLAPIVSSLLITPIVLENAIPKDCSDWIRNETLLSDAISNDSDKNGQWHIWDNWHGVKTLTRYKRRESGNVNSPWQIIPLDHRRNQLLSCLKGMKSAQRRGSQWYSGWTVDFEWENHLFQWYGNPNYDKGELDVYLMENGEKGLEYARYSPKQDKGPDNEKYFGFTVCENDNQDSFIKKMMDLIKKYSDAKLQPQLQ